MFMSTYVWKCLIVGPKKTLNIFTFLTIFDHLTIHTNAHAALFIIMVFIIKLYVFENVMM